MKRWIRSLCMLVGFAALVAACNDTHSSAPSAPASDDAGLVKEPGENDDGNNSPDINLRLGGTDREAVKLECFYALDPAHYGGSSRSIGQWIVSDWNYLANDINAWSRVKDCYSSAWCGTDAFGTYCGCSHGGYGWHLVKGSKSFYRFPSAYGFQDDRYGRAGQCRYFANLILYRSGTGKQLPTYQAAINDYNGQRRYTKPYGQARVGDILQSTWRDGHTAIVVAIIEGQEGVWARKIDVVDANYVGGNGNEIIGRHILDANGSYLGDLDSYLAIDLDKSWS